MRLGLACPDGLPPQDVVRLLCDAGVCGRFDGVAAPALVDERESGGHVWLLASAADVIGACERGAIDAGVAGKDALLEADLEVHELLDLRAGRDVLVYATRERSAVRARRARARVATRYARVTHDYLAAAGEQAEVLEFQAPALAVRLGLADGVVELRERLAGEDAAGLHERDEVASCSARLVCGRAARTLAGAALEDLVERLRAHLEAV
jgi:ATP phosphoribosyltransferase